MKEREDHRAAGVDVFAEHRLTDRAQRVRQQGDLERVLCHVLGHGAAHEHPALNQSKAVQVRKEVSIRHALASPRGGAAPPAAGAASASCEPLQRATDWRFRSSTRITSLSSAWSSGAPKYSPERVWKRHS